MRIPINDYKIILASNSPRRRELLAGIDVVFQEKALPYIDESYPPTLPSEDIAEHLALKKAAAYRPLLQDDELVITADTIVVVEGQVLGKPADIEDAKRMLRLLSGKVHKVITGVCLTSVDKQVSFSDTALVTFGVLEENEIAYYTQAYRPMDKAGAYGVQDWIGYMGVERIEGSYYNVMGLPIYKVYRELKKF